MQAMRKHMHMKTVLLREAPLVLGPSQSAYLAQHVEEAHIVDLPPDLLPSDRNRKMIYGWDKELILNFMCVTNAFHAMFTRPQSVF